MSSAPTNPVNIGGYEIEGVIGSGASGTAYRARDLATGRLVCAKVLADALAADPTFVAGFRTEASTMALVDSEDCVRFFELLETDGRLCLVSELVDGASLRTVLETHGRLSAPQAVGVVTGALSGLSALHGAGIVHRDIKPANIVVDRAGRSKLTDFGLARPVSALADHPGSSVGSPAYMSPEQFRGDAATPASDVYSCAVTLFELLTGDLPYHGSGVRLAAAHASEPVPDPRSIEPGVPAPMADLVMGAMAKDPGDRPPDAAALLAALREAARRSYPGWIVLAGMAGVVAGVLTAHAELSSAVGGGTVSATVDVGAGATTAVEATTPEASGESAGSTDPPGTAPHPSLVSRLGRFVAAKPVVSAVVAVLVVGGAVGGAVGASGGSGPGTADTAAALATCLPGAWQEVTGTSTDEWNGTPVPVKTPSVGPRTEQRYNADGTFYDDYPTSPPAKGTFDGAPFYDQGFGRITGRWKATSATTISTFDYNRTHWYDLLYAAAQESTSDGVPLNTGAITLHVTCSTSTLDYEWTTTIGGKQVHGAMQLQRLAPDSALTAPSSVPDSTGYRSGVDLTSYCQALGDGPARSTKALSGPGAAEDNWTCGTLPTTTFSMDNACQWSSDTPTAVARPVDSDEAYTWLCYQGSDVSVALTVTPPAAGRGTTITVRASRACPAGSTGVVLTASAPTGVVGQVDAGATPEEAVAVPVTLAAALATAQPGTVRMDVTCAGPSGNDLVFLPQTLQFLG